MNEQELMALPVAVDVATAGRALGLSRNTVYRQVKEGTFPLPTIPVGDERYRVPKSAILNALGITIPGTSRTPS